MSSVDLAGVLCATAHGGNINFINEEDEGKCPMLVAVEQVHYYTYICRNSHIHIHVHESIECRGLESHLRQLIFSRKSDCIGCAVLLCLVCLFDLACYFLSSFSSLISKHVYTHIYIQCSTVLVEYLYQNGAKLTLNDERGRGCLHYATQADDARYMYTCIVFTLPTTPCLPVLQCLGFYNMYMYIIVRRRVS